MRRLCHVTAFVVLFLIRFFLCCGQSTANVESTTTASSTGTRIWQSGLRREEGRDLQATVREFYVEFGYSFFIILTEAPSQEHINGMLCETQRKIMLDVTPEFGNDCLELIMTDMSWEFVPEGENWQFLMNSFITTRSVDGGYVPNYLELLDVWQTSFIPQDYITSYLWVSEPEGRNIFFETQTSYFTTDQQVRTPGQLAEINFDCPNNPPPPDCLTAPPTVVVTSPPSSTPTASPTEAPSQIPSKAPTHPPTQLPTTSPSQPPSAVPTDIPSHPPTAGPTTTASHPPSDMPTNSPSFTTSEMPTNSPSHAPSKVPTSSPSRAPSAGPTSVPTDPMPSASPSTTPTLNPTPTMPSHTPSLAPSVSPTGGPTSAPTVRLSDDTVKSMFILRFAFYEGLGREPTFEEVKSVLCLTDVYFFNLFRRIFKDNDMTYDSVNVDWTWNETDPLPLTIIMGANVTYGDGSRPPVEDIINLFDERKNLTIYVDDYVKDVPELESVFYETDYVEFEGIDRVVPVENAKIRSVAEVCVPSPFNRLGGIILPGDLGGGNPDDVATVVLDVDLQDDVARNSNRDLSDDEIQGLGCEINRYLRDILSPYTNATKVSLDTIDIDWTYTPGASEPVAVSFSINSTTTDGGESWPSAVQIVEIWNNHFDAEVFLSNYVRQSAPQDVSVFSDAVGTDYTVEVTDGENTNSASISDTEDCGQTTHSPLARFQLDFAFYELSDIRRLEEATLVVRPPTTDEMQGLACQTNLYFKEILEEVLPGKYFSIEMVGVDWMFDPNFDYPLRVVFHARSTDFDGMTFPVNSFIQEVFQLRFDKDRYIQQYVWKSDPQEESLFFQTEDVTWDFTVRSPGVSRLPSGVCPAATQPPLPTLSFDFGFFDDEEDPDENLERPPTLPEIEGLMCESTDYIEDILAVEYPGESFTVSAVGIDWVYTEGVEEPVGVTFSAETRLENGTLFPPADEMVALLNRTMDIDTYMREYVWKSEPTNENMFYETETLSWDIEERVPDESAELAKAKCPDDNDDDSLNLNGDDDGNGNGNGNGDDDGNGNGNGDDDGNGNGSGNGDDDGNGNGLGGDGKADRDRGLDWWHWFLIILYILFVICLICTLLQCYHYLLSHYDEDDLVEEDPPKEKDIMMPRVEEPVDEDLIYGPRDPKGHHIDKLAPLLPIKEASQSGDERDDTEGDLIDLNSDEDEDEAKDRELFAGDEDQEDNLIDTLTAGEAYDQDDIDMEESDGSEVGSNNPDRDDDDARGQQRDIVAPPLPVVPAGVDGPVTTNRDFVESEDKDNDEESEVSLDQYEIFQRSSSDESWDDDEYDTDSDGSSTDEHSYDDDEHGSEHGSEYGSERGSERGSDEEWEDEGSNYSGSQADSLHDEMNDEPNFQGSEENFENTVRRSNRQLDLDLAIEEDDWQDEESPSLDKPNEEQMAGHEHDEFEADRTLGDEAGSWDDESYGGSWEDAEGSPEHDNRDVNQPDDRIEDNEVEDHSDGGSWEDAEGSPEHENRDVNQTDDRIEDNEVEDHSDGGSWEDAEGSPEHDNRDMNHADDRIEENDVEDDESDGGSWEDAEGSPEHDNRDMNQTDDRIEENDVEDNGSDGGSWEDAKGSPEHENRDVNQTDDRIEENDVEDESDDGSWEESEGDEEAGLETADVLNHSQEYDDLERDGDSWEDAGGDEAVIQEEEANERDEGGELENTSKKSDAEDDDGSGELWVDSDSFDESM